MSEIEKCELAKTKGFTYCSISGNVRGIKGNVIGSKNDQGYIRCCIRIAKKRHEILGHRLAWFLHYGKLPVNQIDHIDGNKSNNKIENLRDVTCQYNHFNRTTAKGYSWDKPNKKFRAHIKLNGKLIYLGLFKTETEAHNAYLAAKEKYHLILN